MSGFDDIFNQFSSEFENFEPTPSPELWGKLNNKLKNRRRRRASAFFCVCLFFAGLFSYNVYEFMRIPNLPVVKAVWDGSAWHENALNIPFQQGLNQQPIAAIADPAQHASRAFSAAFFEPVTALSDALYMANFPLLAQPNLPQLNLPESAPVKRLPLSFTKEQPHQNKVSSTCALDVSGGMVKMNDPLINPERSAYGLILHGSETPLPSRNLQVKLSRQISPHWRVSGGVAFTQQKTEQTYNFTQWLDESNRVRFYDEATDSYFEVNYKNRRMVTSNYHGVYTANWLSIPIQANYEFGKKIKGYAGAGIQANILLSQSGKLLTVSNAPVLEDVRTASQVNPFQWQAKFVAGVIVPVTSHIGLTVEPYFVKGLNNELRTHTGVTQTSSGKGLNLGLRFQF